LNVDWNTASHFWEDGNEEYGVERYEDVDAEAEDVEYWKMGSISL
jgi:hypothetical protein